MKINFSKLRTGDTFFVRSYTPIGFVIQVATGWGKPTHCGKILRENGRMYVVEMIGDLNLHDNDFIIRPINYYLKSWRFWTSIISIKRSEVYDDISMREVFIRWVNEMKIKDNPYDNKELLAFRTKEKIDKSPDLICSRLVYEVDKLCGVDFGKDEKKFEEHLVSPVDLWESSAYFEVENWRRPKDERNRFRHGL